jgi:putative DNA primase/helicase
MSERAIQNAVDRAEAVQDPLEALLANSAHDPGAPITTDGLALLADLKTHDTAGYERARAKLRSTDVRIGELDKALSVRMQSGDCATNGRPLTWDEPEPWPSPVDGAELLNEVVQSIKRYLVLPSAAAETMALWAMFAHSHDAWFISPRLAFLSPEKRCGKTTALFMMQQLVPKPLLASNITPSAVFRSIEMATPTLLIDEADTFLDSNDELRGILNSGHNKAGAFVVRNVGDDHTPAQFCTWSPVVIAMIGNLPETLNDRALVISLQRKNREDRVARFRLDRVEFLKVLWQKLARWAGDNIYALRSWDGQVPETLLDRAADNWRPLLAIADTVGGSWPEVARQAALALTDTDDEGSVGTLLLQDLKRLFDDEGVDRLQTDRILAKLHAMEERPWPEWRQGKPLTARQLSKLLKPFGISPRTIRLEGDVTAKGYYLKDLKGAFARYTPSLSVTPSQTAETLGFLEDLSVTSPEDVTDKKAPKPAENLNCDAVTDKDGGTWEEVL